MQNMKQILNSTVAGYYPQNIKIVVFLDQFSCTQTTINLALTCSLLYSPMDISNSVQMTIKASTQSKSISNTTQFYCNNNIQNISLNLDLTYATQVLVYIYSNNVSGQLLVGIQFGYIICQMPQLLMDMICDKNQYLNITTNKCTVCDSNCSKCSYQGVCLDCVQGYYINQSKCEKGNIQNVVQNIFNNTIQLVNNQYYMQNFPLHCKEGYQLDSNRQCVVCSNTQGLLCTISQSDSYSKLCDYSYQYQFNDYQCSKCTNGFFMNQFCVLQCPKYYQPDSFYQNCTSVGIPNCILSQNSQCQLCDSNFILDSQKACVTISCPSNCATCVSQNICSQCNPGYYLQNNDCYPQSVCENNIISKNNISVCQVCETKYFSINLDKTCTLKQYYFLVYLNGIFIPKLCSNCQFQQDCPECIGNSPCLLYSQLQTCMQCDSNYILDNNGQCQQKQSFISDYNQIADFCIEYNSTSTQCISCLTGYYVSISGQCLKCIFRLSDTNACAFNCPSGYYSNSQTYICHKCQDSNCSVCDSSLNCQTCNQNYHLYNSVCYQDQCLQNQYRQNLNQICQNCYYRCATCDQQGVSGNICLTCLNGLNLGTDGVCHICQIGYFYNGNEDSDLKNSSVDLNKCQVCDSSCKECQGISTNCTVCQYTLTLNSQNKCVIACPNGYYQNTSTAQCVLCSDPNCSTCNSSLICTHCNQNYVLTPQQICSNTCPIGHYNHNQICEQCQAYCSSCLSLNACLSCEQNFDLINGQCYQKCSKLQYRDQQTLKCMQCDSSCLACSGPLNTNCISCSPKLAKSSYGKCSICDEGEFYQRNEQQDIQNGIIDYLSCKKCDSSCQYCNGFTKYECITCISGLFYDEMSKLCITKQEIVSQQSNLQKCQNLLIKTQSYNDCNSQLEQIDLLANLNLITSLCLVSGGFFLSIFVPQIGCMMWFYLQTQQMRGNTYFAMPFLKQGVSSYFLQNSYLHNIFVAIQDPIQQSNIQQFQTLKLLNGAKQLRTLLDTQSLRSFYIENCMYQSFVLLLSFLIIPALFQIGKKNQTANKFYNYCKWNLPIRACMLCSNLIIVSVLINFKNLKNMAIFETVYVASFIIIGVIIILYIFIITKCIILIYFFSEKYQYQVQQNYNALIGQLKDKNRFTQSFWLFLELKKIISIFILLIVENYMVSGWICLTGEILFLAYVVSLRTFISRVLNGVIITLQLVQTFLLLIVCLLQQQQTDLLIKVFEITSISEKLIGLFGLVLISVRCMLKHYYDRKINKILKSSQNMTCELKKQMDNKGNISYFEMDLSEKSILCCKCLMISDAKTNGQYQYSYYGKNKEYYTETLYYPSDCNNHSIVFLFQSGNPGYIRFYERFLLNLSQAFNKMYDVIGIGQAGQFKRERSFKRCFTLKQQIDHKIQYFNALIRQASITPKGQERNNLHRYKLFFQIALKFIDYFIPLSLLRFICLKAYEKDRIESREDINDCAENVAQWIGYETGLSFMYLTIFQFDEINQLNEQEIKKFYNKMTIYYAKGDEYTLEYIQKDFKDKFSNFIDCFEDEVGLAHAFIFGGSKIEAYLIRKLLSAKI
ncbi:hypothetical protein ABPG72_001002 [Tetrahymena utriculariae]